jgi:predicted transcriptional regulator
MYTPIRTRPLTVFKIIEVLTANPNANFTETAKKTGLSTRTLNKALKKLEQRCVITRQRQGRNIIFAVNQAEAVAYLDDQKLTRQFGNRYSYVLQNRFTPAQLKEAQLIEAADQHHNGKVKNWFCPWHNRDHVKFCSLGKGVLVYCDMLGCNQSRAFNYKP